MALSLIFLSELFKKNKVQRLKKILVLVFATFIINAYWLLPFLYFTATSSSVVSAAKENYMATDDIYLRNKEFGTIPNVALIKGFWFKFVDYGANRELNYMIDPWLRYSASPIILLSGYFFFFLILLGLLSQSKKRSEFSYSLILLFMLPFSMLLTDTFPFSELNNVVRSYIPLFSQVFRVPFTKFAILASLTYSILFAFGVGSLVSIMEKYYKRASLIILPILVLIFIYALPIFQGKLFYDNVKLKIPDEYFETFKYFSNKGNTGRIANFPQASYWGWNHYSWGGRGSGFIWYGIENPILDRAFDGYSTSDENYYWEISQAIYSGNQEMFEKSLDKYQILWLLVDDSVISFSSQKEIYFNKLDEMIGKSQKITPSAVFGKIRIYRVLLTSEPKNLVFLSNSLVNIGPQYKWNNYDKAYEEYGNYISDNRQQITDNKTNNSNDLKPITYNLQPDVYYPFRSLFTGRKQEELEFGVEDLGTYFSFKTKIPKSMEGAKLVIPKFGNEVFNVGEINLDNIVSKDPQVFLDGEVIQNPPPLHLAGIMASPPEVDQPATPEVKISSEVSLTLPYIKEGNLEVRVPKVGGLYSYDSNVTFDVFENVPKTCDQFNKGLLTQETVIENNTKLLKLTSVGSSNCLDMDLGNLAQRYGYLVTVESKNVEGKSLLISVINKNSQRSDLETYLPKKPLTYNLKPNTSFFILPPMEPDAIGYTLHFDNISIGRVKTVNELGRITVNPIPYKFLTSLKIVTDLSAFKGQTLKGDIKVDHPNPSFYKVDLSADSTLTPNTYMVLSQSFDKGWKAYEISCQLSVVSCQLKKLFPFIFFKEIKDHVLVNNWENGWDLSSTSYNLQPVTIIIVYLPQYLEYLGFSLLVIFLGFLFLTREKKYPHGIKIEPVVN